MMRQRAGLIIVLTALLTSANTLVGGGVATGGVISPVGSISGTVTNGAGTPLADVQVYACAPSYCDSDVTDATGAYQIIDLPEDPYRVEFTDLTGTYAFEYYDDTLSYSLATEVPVVGGSDTPGIDAVLELGGAVSGTVTDDVGAPLAGISVELCDQFCGYDSTAADGTYTVSGLPAGTYDAAFADYGGTYVTEYWNDTIDYSLATPIVVAAGGAVTGIDAALATGGTISGTVTDTIGTPLGDIDVYVCLDGSTFCQYGYTAADGTYTTGALPPGNFVVEFIDFAGNYIAEYWDDTLDQGSATPITVAAGAAVGAIDAALDVGATISGTVTDDTGTPLPDIDVTGCPTAAGPCGYDVTAADGTYTLGGLAGGDHIVEFYDYAGTYIGEYWDDAPDSASANPIAVPGGGSVTGIDAALSSGGTITGTVTDEIGTPLADIDVNVCPDGPGGCGYATTAADGTYTVTALGDGDYRVQFYDYSSVYVPEYWDDADYSTATLVSVTTGTIVTNIDAALAIGATLSGTVTDTTGTPLADIDVTACPNGPGGCGYATTAADGTYTVTGLGAGDYRVDFWPGSGSYVPEYYDDVPDYGSATLVPVPAGGAVTGIDAALAEGGGVSGTVTDITGAPISGIYVQACPTVAGSGCGYAFSAADGTYDVTSLDAGDHTVQFIDFDGTYVSEYYDDALDYVAATPVAVVGGATVTGIDAVLAVGGSISGTVTDITGAPVPDIDVSACDDVSGYCYWGYTATDGTYAVGSLPTGDYRVEFYDYGNFYQPEYWDDVTDYAAATLISVTAGSSVTDIDAVLEAPDMISGTVTDLAGAPLFDIGVVACDDFSGTCEYAFTAVDGTYGIKSLPDGDYRVEFFDPSQVYIGEFWNDTRDIYSATVIPITSASEVTGIDAALELGGTVSGTVTNAAGAPLIDIYVSVCDDVLAFCGDTSTAADGTYTVGGIPTGNHRVQFIDFDDVYVDEYWDDTINFSSATLVPVTAGGSVTGIDAVLDLGGSITGTITDDLGAPIPFAGVNANSTNGGFGYTTADAAGVYVISSLPADDYRVYAYDPAGLHQGLYWDGKVDYFDADLLPVTPDTVSFADLSLPRMGAVSGTITDASGAPLGNINVNVFDDNFGNSVYTAPDGTYEVVTPPGSFTVRFDDYSGTYGSEYYSEAATMAAATPVVVTPGTTTTGVDNVLDAAGAVAGVVTDDTGAPLVGAYAAAFASDGTILGAVTSNALGEYTLPHLTGGQDVTVQFSSSPDFLPLWFDGSLNEAGAVPVAIVPGATTPGIDGQLVRPGGVSGTVVDGAGAPLAGIEVWTCTTNYPWGWQACVAPDTPAVTDGAGNYLVATPAVGDLIVFHDPTGTYGDELVPITLGIAPIVVDATLLDLAIAGTVTEDGTGVALGGVTVTACLTAPDVYIPDLCRTTTTAGDGTYALGGLGSGEYTVRFAVLTHITEFFGGDNYPPGITVSGDAPVPTPGIDAQLAPGSTISGTVTDSAGAPLGGIEVTSYVGFEPLITTTAGDGTYTIGPFAAGWAYLDFVDPAGDHIAVSTNTPIGPATDITGIDITMADAGKISGVVTDGSTGLPLEGAYVYAGSVGCCSGADAVTDASGAYTLGGLDPADTYILTFNPPYPSPLLFEYWDDTSDYFAATPVAVTAGVTATGFDAVLDLPTCGGLPATVLIGQGDVPTNGADVIVGTFGPDVIDGLGGDDTICGGWGNDTINGGTGRDTIYGEGDIDTIDGGKGNDIIYGGEGGDDLFGGGGGDKLYGEGGDDRVRGSIGNDYIEGGPGNDELRGQNGSDTVYANSAADASTVDTDEMYGGGLYDTMVGDNGPDLMYGGDFADTLSGRAGDDDLYGNNGVDTLKGGAHDTGDYCNGGAINSGSGDTAVACETIVNVPFS